MKRLIALAAALMFALLMPLEAAADPTDGVIRGRVVNGSNGGAAPAGDDVALLIFGVKEQRQLDEKTVKVDVDGTFTFSGVDRDPNLAYFVLVVHQDVSYPVSTPFQMKDSTSQDVEVRVYDKTNSDAALRFDRLNLLVAGAEPGILQMLEMGSIVNDGDRTFVPENPQEGVLARAVQFGLPKGALDAQFQAGFSDQDVLPSVSGIQVNTPLKPGRQEFALAFAVPYTGSAADLSLQLSYPAGAFTVYAPENGPRIDSQILRQQGSGNMGGQTFTLYSASEVARGTVVPAQLTGLAWGGGAGLSPNQLALVSLGVVMVIVGGGVLVLGRVRRSGSATPRFSSGEAEDDERLQLVVRLASLDERFAAGQIPEAQYRVERERGKRRLLELAGGAPTA